MSWLRLTVLTSAEQGENVADYLERFGANAVSFSPASDEKLFAEPGQERPTLWQQTRVSGLFPADVDMDVLLGCLRQSVPTEQLFKVDIEAVAEQDWQDNFQQAVAIQHFGGLCICPSWLSPPEQSEQTIILDPGLAFGTGTHPTTHLCLRWLCEQNLHQRSLIDFGCGSGILAMAAARRGAAPVMALDIDPQALTAAHENFHINALEHDIQLMSEHSELPQAEILVANILLNPLLEFAERFSQLVMSQGQCVLSGILLNQIDECVQCYEKWFTVTDTVIEQEWALISGVRK